MALMKSAMPGRRSASPIAGSLDVLGDPWSLVVVRDLMFRDKHEYGDFLGSEEGITTNVLADTLTRLTEVGIVLRLDHPTERNKYIYRLSEMGIDLLPLIIELAHWGTKYVPNNGGPPKALKDVLEKRAEVIERIRKKLFAELNAPVTA